VLSLIHHPAIAVAVALIVMSVKLLITFILPYFFLNRMVFWGKHSAFSQVIPPKSSIS
jgi:hypothetical protein